jgi:hypothetical protein
MVRITLHHIRGSTVRTKYLVFLDSIEKRAHSLVGGLICEVLISRVSDWED